MRSLTAQLPSVDGCRSPAVVLARAEHQRSSGNARRPHRNVIREEYAPTRRSSFVPTPLRHAACESVACRNAFGTPRHEGGARA